MKNIHLIISQSLVAFFSLAGVVSLAQTAKAETITGQLGNVRAEISYDKPQDFEYKNVKIKIIRSGKTVLEQKQPQQDESDRPLGTATEKLEFPVIDLDRDKEPEVIADFFTGGAHCCTYSLIYRYDKAKKQYVKTFHEWGNGGYVLRDIDKDGRSEFSSRDDRFAYAFTSYAASGYPVQIWQYRGGKMTDVTRNYPSFIAQDAKEQLQYLVTNGRVVSHELNTANFPPSLFDLPTSGF
jgi:hypothetical protein